MTSRSNQTVLRLLDGLLLAGLVAAMVLRTLVPGLSTSFYAPSVNLFVDALPLLLIALFVLRFLLEPKRVVPRWGAGLAAVLFLGWAALPAFLAGERSVAVETWCDWAGVLTLAYLLHLLVQDRGTRSAILGAFVVLGGVVAVLGLEEAYVGKEIAREMFADHPELVRVTPELLSEFEGRLRSGEVSGPFLLSNLLAGYLIVLIPVTFGLLLDLRTGVRTLAQRIRIGLLIAFLILEGWCLAITGSKGGWVALAGGAVAFGVALRAPRAIVARTTMGVAAALVGLLLVTGGVTRLPGATRIGGQSMEIRDEYFAATRAMIADQPFLGVGVGNFRHHYPAYRLPTAEETKFAHNHYLQVAAETGVPGLALLLFLAACLLAWTRRGHREESASAGRRSPVPIFLGGAGAIVALSAFAPFSVRYSDWTSQALILAVWTLFLILYCLPERRGGGATPPGKGVRAGAMAAAVAAGLHGGVDLGLYSAGILFAIVAAILLASPPATRGWIVPLGTRLVLILATLTITACVYMLYLPGMIRHDFYFTRAEDQFWEAYGRGTEGPERRWRLEAAADFYAAATREKPWDGRALLQRGRVLLALHELRAAGTTGGRGDLDAAIEDLERASALAPASAERRFELGMAQLALAAYDPLALDQAEENLAAAVARYPTKPAYRFQYARFLFEVRHKVQGREGALESARVEAKEAIDLSRLTRHDRLRLSPEAIATCLQILAD